MLLFLDHILYRIVLFVHGMLCALRAVLVITSKLSMRLQTQTTFPQCLVCFEWCFKQLQEILLFSYFLSIYKSLMHFRTFLGLSSTPNTFFKINTKSKTNLYLLIFFLQNHQSYQIPCGLFHFKTWHFVIKWQLLGVPSWKGNFAYFTLLLQKVFGNKLRSQT